MLAKPLQPPGWELRCLWVLWGEGQGLSVPPTGLPSTSVAPGPHAMLVYFKHLRWNTWTRCCTPCSILACTPMEDRQHMGS